MGNDVKIHHLEAIQGVINRMAQNSFLIKGWSVTLVSALFALATAQSNSGFVLLAYVPACMFWILDGYFLYQEKLYRRLFDHVRISKESEPAEFFSMDTTSFRNQMPSWLCVALSRTLLVFHGAVLGSIILVMILVRKSAIQ